MSAIIRKSLNSPEEVFTFELGMGRMDSVNAEAGAVARATYLPGWQWSKHVKPLVHTDSCQDTHVGYTISGHMKVVMDDGEEAEIGPGDFSVIPPGHDEWVVGDEPVIMIDWHAYAEHAISWGQLPGQ